MSRRSLPLGHATCLHCSGECRLCGGLPAPAGPSREAVLRLRPLQGPGRLPRRYNEPHGTRRGRGDARSKLHKRRFDSLWKGQPDRKRQRSACYRFLAKALGIERDECHAGMFTIEQCRDAWKALRGQTPDTIRQWNDARRTFAQEARTRPQATEARQETTQSRPRRRQVDQTRPTMRFVPIKTVEQQSVLMVHRTRDLLIRQRTMLINAIRSHLAEFGIVAGVGRNGVEKLLALIAEGQDERVPPVARDCLVALTVEPMTAPLGDVDLSDIHWVILGGESGPRARPMKLEWAREVRDQCIGQNVPLFFKQWGKPDNNPLFRFGGPAHVKQQDPIGKGGSLLDGRQWHQWPFYAEDPTIMQAA